MDLSMQGWCEQVILSDANSLFIGEILEAHDLQVPRLDGARDLGLRVSPIWRRTLVAIMLAVWYLQKSVAEKASGMSVICNVPCALSGGGSRTRSANGAAPPCCQP